MTKDYPPTCDGCLEPMVKGRCVNHTCLRSDSYGIPPAEPKKKALCR